MLPDQIIESNHQIQGKKRKKRKKEEEEKEGTPVS